MQSTSDDATAFVNPSHPQRIHSSPLQAEQTQAGVIVIVMLEGNAVGGPSRAR
jgi:hypothetical protein